MDFKFFKNQMSLPLRSIAIGTFLAFAGGLFINSSSNEYKVVSMQENLFESALEKNEIKNEDISVKDYGLFLFFVACFLSVGYFSFCLVPKWGVKIENESKNDSSFEKDENSTKLENNSYSEIKEEEEEKKKKEEEDKRKKEEEEKKRKEEEEKKRKEEEEKRKKEEEDRRRKEEEEKKRKEEEEKKKEVEVREKEGVKEKVINGDFSNGIAGIAAVSALGGIIAFGEDAVRGINKLVNSSKLVNAKVKVGQTLDANKVKDGEGTLEKAKDVDGDESNETKKIKNLN